MIVPFGISAAFGPGSDKELNADSLKILLEALIALDIAYLRTMARKGKTISHLYDSGVVYGRTQSWDTIPDLYLKGFGDCKSLTAAFCAQARLRGLYCEPTFRWVVRPKDNGLDFHILVRTDGTMTLDGHRLELYHDPSKLLGMTDDAPQTLY